MATLAGVADWLRAQDVIELLRPRHPHLNVSKIRFLESEGKIRPIRDKDGYLRYDPQEVAAAMPYPEW